MYAAKVKIESMEEYSETKTYKSKPELRNSKVLSIFIHQSGNNNYCKSHGVCLRKTTDKPTRKCKCSREMLQMLADTCASSCLEYLTQHKNSFKKNGLYVKTLPVKVKLRCLA